MKPAAPRKINILLSDSCGSAATRLVRILPSLRIPAELIKVPAGELRAKLSERPVDALILGEGDFDLAEELSSHSYTAVLLIAGAEALSNLRSACIAAGILSAGEDELETALSQLLASCIRLRTIRIHTSTLQRRLDDTKIVNRAKLLLVTRLKMSEGEAHRYIEKTAMDSCSSRRDVAESIIRTYEE